MSQTRFFYEQKSKKTVQPKRSERFLQSTGHDDDAMSHDIAFLQNHLGNRTVLRMLREGNIGSLQKNLVGNSPVQLQQHQRQTGRRRWRPQPVSNPQLIDRLLAPNSPLWRQLNPDSNAEVNCPATAAAVDEYLSTGRIRPAPPGEFDSQFRFDARPWSRPMTNFNQIRTLVSQPNTFVVVQGTRSQQYIAQNHVTPDHWFVIVNRNGIRGLDVYGSGQVIGDLNSFIQQEGFVRFRYYQGAFRVTEVPAIFPEGL